MRLMRSIGWGIAIVVVMIGLGVKACTEEIIGIGETGRTEVTFWIGGDEIRTLVMRFGAKEFIGDTC